VNILRFLRDQAKNYDCAACGSNHASSEIRVLGRLDSAWVIRVTCTSCQTSFKLLVVVDAAAGVGSRASFSPVKEDHPSERRKPPVTPDDVLDAHEFLSTYEGGLDVLVKREGVADRRADRSG
jgi:hypothetical protein